MNAHDEAGAIVDVPRDLLERAAGHLAGAQGVLELFTGIVPSGLDVDEEWGDTAFALVRALHHDFDAAELEDDKWETHPGNVELEARAAEEVATLLAALGDSELAEGAREEARAIREQGTIDPTSADGDTKPPAGRGTSSATVPTATTLASIREAFRGEVLPLEGRFAVARELEGAIAGFGGCLPHVEALVRGEGTEPATSIAPMLERFDKGMAHLQGAVTSALRPTSPERRAA